MTLRRAVLVKDRSLTGVGSKCSGFKYKVKWGHGGVWSRCSGVKMECGQGEMGSRWSGFKVEWF